jgi:hypothetical protein
VRLFEAGKEYFFGGVGRNYDVTADGRRFVMVKHGPEGAAAVFLLQVVTNWAAEIRRATTR